ncbi:unnamed protein product [Owenia fusiformis]|uniref:Uncharacterized protein n=1 Tax=Owenia fusiformis TaxID=6347 RepID=A0A8J1XE95_OWEFU|nr:unnamed protein product [Owenia fusiformis]
MAKSLRSKHRRKMRAVKRKKNEPKELAKLKKVLGLGEKNQDVEMKELYTVVDAEKVKEDQKKRQEAIEANKGPAKFHPKTLKDEHGNYPNWMNQRQIKKMKGKSKKKTKKSKAW